VARFTCDDHGIEKLLVRLARDVSALGGGIHPEVQISCEDGDLSIRADGALALKTPLISVPEPALLPVDEIGFVVRDDELGLASPQTHLSPARRRLLDTMLEIYRRTGKIGSHRATSPWLALAHEPTILERLVQGRATAPAIRNFHRDFLEGRYDELTTKSFIKTRTLGFRLGAQRPTPVLMPIIDFVNHHPGAPGFRTGTDSTGIRRVAIQQANPIAASAECYVRYGNYDALDTYLVYGFVEQSAPFVRSVPLNFQLDGIGTIEVHSAIGSNKAAGSGKLPPHLQAVRQFMPAVQPVSETHLILSHLMIPAGPPEFALRRILQELLVGMRPNLDQVGLQNYVAKAESEIISRNIAFYEQLIRLDEPKSDTSTDRSAVSTVRQMAEIQLAKLQEYQAKTLSSAL
jgi:hypothetical protein